MAKGQWSGGKGSDPRPISDRKSYEANWDRIFGQNHDSASSSAVIDYDESDNPLEGGVKRD